MTVREEIAKNLHFYRKNRGITQKELAAKVGVTNSAISNWEKGLNSIDIDTLHNVCIALDVSISEMFGVYANNPDTLTDFDHTLITAYRAHPEAQPSVNKLLDIAEPFDLQGKSKAPSISEDIINDLTKISRATSPMSIKPK